MIMGILTGIHALIYISVVKFIPFFGTFENRKFLLTGIILLASSFPVFLFLNHLKGNVITRFLNGVGGFWFTLSIYLVMSFLIVWFLRMILWFLQTPEESVFSIIHFCTIGFISAAVLLNTWGLIKALTVQTTVVEVKIKNLPASWEAKTILQISDVHLGGTWGPNRVDQLTKIAVSTKPEVIVITGDLFDGASGVHREFIESLSKLAATKPPGGIYFTSGNHERYTDYKDSIETIKKSNITILENEVINVHGLQFVGIQYPDLRNFHKTAVDFNIQKHPEYKKERPTVLLYHTPTDFNDGNLNLSDIQKKAYINPDTNFEHAKSIGIDLQLSGHTHAGQFFPFIGITKKIYNGFHYGLHSSGDFQIYISSGAGTWGPPIRHSIPCEAVLLKLYKK
ncbi:MAG: metallophosphoesterase [Spirochaetia bacterium]|nr:metallophosphoesterase [Spirochaetia bacterium]